MKYINEIRNRCYNKMVDAEKNNNFEKVELYRKIGLHLSNATFFMSIDITTAFQILSLLDFSEEEIDVIYPKLILYDNLFFDEDDIKKKI